MKRRNFLKTTVATGLASSVDPSKAGADESDNPPSESRSMNKPRIMFYHDGRHPLIYMYEPPMQKEEFEAGVDELVGTPIEAILFCLGDGRTVLHDTRVGELWGHNVKEWPHGIFRRAHQNAKQLIESGNDPLQIICDRAHANEILVYATLLVQQGAGKRGEDVRCSEFRFNNRHLEIGAGGGVNRDFPGFHGLDFKHKEVREERFALIEETLTRYPVDGFELHLNYTPYYFRPDEVEAGREIMTAWVERVYRAVKASGADRELAIRIPATLEGCFSVGMDVREWLRRGIVDVLIGQGHFYGLLDQTADFRPLVEACKGSQCRLHADLQIELDSDRLRAAPIEMTRAAACNYWAQGVDGLLLDKWFVYWPYQAPFYEQLRELPHPDVMAPKDKSYFVPTTTGQDSQLPADLKLNKPVRVEWTITDDLPRWSKVGRVHEVLLRLRLVNTTELDRLSFRFNGKLLPDSLLRKINRMYKMVAPRYRVFGYWFIYRLDAEHWPMQGKNMIDVTLTRRDPDVTAQIALRDVEMEIKYLMGKNFHRGEDLDLGPHESSSV